MILHDYFRSSSAWRCRIALGLKGIEAERAFVHLRRNGGEQKTPEYRALNPQAMVPTLVLDDGTALTQSLAIIEFLDETIPEPPLLPSDPVQRAKVRGAAQVIACDIHPLHNLRVLQYLRETWGSDADAVNAWCARWIGDGLTALETMVDAEDVGPYCFGPTPGLADICLVPQLGAATRFGVDPGSVPRLRAIGEALNDHPAFAAAVPARQPDAES